LCQTLNKEKSEKNLEEDVENVYFGHTHNAFEDHRHEGLRFFNTGSGLVNSHLKLIEVR
jgi:predicted phosphodiesterase